MKFVFSILAITISLSLLAEWTSLYENTFGNGERNQKKIINAIGYKLKDEGIV